MRFTKLWHGGDSAQCQFYVPWDWLAAREYHASHQCQDFSLWCMFKMNPLFLAPYCITLWMSQNCKEVWHLPCSRHYVIPEAVRLDLTIDNVGDSNTMFQYYCVDSWRTRNQHNQKSALCLTPINAIYNSGHTRSGAKLIICQWFVPYMSESPEWTTMSEKSGPTSLTVWNKAVKLGHHLSLSPNACQEKPKREST